MSSEVIVCLEGSSSLRGGAREGGGVGPEKVGGQDVGRPAAVSTAFCSLSLLCMDSS